MGHHTKQTWDEIIKRFPDQWILVEDFDTDECGRIVTGLVTRHGDTMESIALPPTDGTPTAFLYTGESTFMGLRSHADQDAI